MTTLSNLQSECRVLAIIAELYGFGETADLLQTASECHSTIYMKTYLREARKKLVDEFSDMGLIDDITSILTEDIFLSRSDRNLIASGREDLVYV